MLTILYDFQHYQNHNQNDTVRMIIIIYGYSSGYGYYDSYKSTFLDTTIAESR